MSKAFGAPSSDTTDTTVTSELSETTVSTETSGSTETTVLIVPIEQPHLIEPAQLTVEQREIALQGIAVPFDCACQYGYTHSYTRQPWVPRTVYTYDGDDVFAMDMKKMEGVPINDEVLAHNAHYGEGGRAGPYEHKSVRKLVKAKYHEHFTNCQLARSTGQPIPPMPEPFHFYVTFCGN